MRRAVSALAGLALLAGACQSDAPAKDGGLATGNGTVTTPGQDTSPTAAPSAGPGQGTTDAPTGEPAFNPTPTAPRRGDSPDLALAIGRGREVGTEWEIVVVGYDPDATDEVLEFNPGNAEPPPGEVFALARIQATYIGPDDSANAFLNLEWALVDAAGELHTDADCGVLPDDLASQSGVPNGQTAEGTICMSVPEDLLAQVALHLAPLLGPPGSRVWWDAPKEGAGRVLDA